MSSSVSFAGIASGVNTDALVSAIMAQDSLPLTNLQNQVSSNTTETSALNALQTDMSNLTTSLQTLQYSGTGFNAETVTSSDTTNTYATATANGAAIGNYQIQVSSVATSGRILPTLNGSGNPDLAVANASGGGTSQIFTPGGTPPTFAIQGVDGSVQTITLNAGNNSLNGLASAINSAFGSSAPGAGVTASVVNTGTGATPYQLVLTANSTGTGTTGGVVSIADVTSGNTATTSDNLIGIPSGTVGGTATAPTITGGLQSAAATNAVFTVNGIQLTRQSNTVTDAVSGLTLNLTQGGQTGTTTLAVAADTATITTSMQAVITNYNQLISDYNTNSTATKDANGNIVPAPLSNDSTGETIINQVQAALTGIPPGMSSTSPYKSIGDLGITENSDGTLSLDTSTFTTAITTNPVAAANVFNFSGTTSNGVVTFNQASGSTTAQSVAFNVTSYNGNTGAWSGTLAADGGPAVNVSGTSGGPANPTTPGASLGTMAGLQLNVTGTGSGTLSLTQGVAQVAQNTIGNLTGLDGTIWNTLQSLSSANTNLQTQISSEQSLLASRQAQLQTQFADMEAAVAQMKTASAGMVSSSTAD